MKRIYSLSLMICLFFAGILSAQQAYIKVPAFQTTTTNIKAPNGNSVHATFRGVYLLTASELTVVGTNTAINAVGFFISPGVSPAVTGTIQFYFQNTSDVTYQKGTNFTAAIAPMTSVYNNTMVINPGTQTITLPFPSNFTYTGGGLYIAMDWVSTGPFSTGLAVYQADNSLPVGGAAASTTAVPASNTLAQNSVRPIFRLGYVNTYTNEAQVYGVYGNGRHPLVSGSPYSFSVALRNNSGVTMTNVVPTLSVTGPTSFVTTATLASIAPGATAVVAFPGFSPTAQGMHTVNVSVPADENNNNNSVTIQHSVTCNYINTAPPLPISQFSTQSVGFNTSSGLLLTRINMANTATLTGLRLGIGNNGPNAGNGVYGVVTDQVGNILATTNTVVLQPSMFSTYQLFNFAAPPTLTGNTPYYIGMAQPQNSITGYFPLATLPTPTNNMPTNIYATSLIGGGFISTQTPTLGWFAIEGVVDNGISLTVTPQTSTICSNNTLAITASGASSYSWSNGGNTAAITVSPMVYSAYTCTGSAVVGTVGACEAMKTAVVYVNLTPTINCANGAICPTPGSFTLSPTGAATYTFSGGSNVVSPTVTTQYTITGTSGAGCPAANTVVTTVSVSNTPAVTITGPTLTCLGDNQVITANGCVTYQWDSGSNSPSVIVTPTANTTYSVTGYFGTCSATAVHNMSVSNIPTLSAQSLPSVVCIGNTATLSAFGASTYTWSNGQVGLTCTVTPTVQTDYTLTGAINGICVASIVVTQSVMSCVGINEQQIAEMMLNIYPNPTNGNFHVSVSQLNAHASIVVYNAIGQAILSEDLRSADSYISMRNQPKGIYFVQLKESGNVVRTVRIVIE